MIKTSACTIGGFFRTNRRMIFVSEANSTPVMEDKNLCDADADAIILCQENMGLRNQKFVLQALQTPGGARIKVGNSQS